MDYKSSVGRVPVRDERVKDSDREGHEASELPRAFCTVVLENVGIWSPGGSFSPLQDKSPHSLGSRGHQAVQGKRNTDKTRGATCPRPICVHTPQNNMALPSCCEGSSIFLGMIKLFTCTDY